MSILFYHPSRNVRPLAKRHRPIDPNLHIVWSGRRAVYAASMDPIGAGLHASFRAEERSPHSAPEGGCIPPQHLCRVPARLHQVAHAVVNAPVPLDFTKSRMQSYNAGVLQIWASTTRPSGEGGSFDSCSQGLVDELIPEEQIACFWKSGHPYTQRCPHSSPFWLASILVIRNGLLEMARFWTSGLPRFSARNVTVSRCPSHVGVLLFWLVTTLFHDTAHMLSQHQTMASASSGKPSDAPASHVDTRLVEAWCET